MASRRDDDTTPSPEAIRQLRIAIQQAAREAGASISPDDATVLAAILSTTPASQLEALARRGDGMLGSVASVIQNLTKNLAEQQKEARLDRHDAQEPGAGKGPQILRGPLHDLWRHLVEQASNESGTKSSWRYTGMGKAPGNADTQGFSLADYNSPLVHSMIHMGVTSPTFGYLRGEGFQRRHIYDAAKDARALDFGVNNKRIMKNLATIEKDGNDPKETVRRMKEFQGDLRKSDEFRKAVSDYDAAKTDADREKALQRINEIADKIADKKGGVTEDQKRQRSQAVQEAIGETRQDIVKQQMEETRELRQRMGLEQREQMFNTAQDATISAADQQRTTAERQKIAANSTHASGQREADLNLLGPAASGPAQPPMQTQPQGQNQPTRDAPKPPPAGSARPASASASADLKP